MNSSNRAAENAIYRVSSYNIWKLDGAAESRTFLFDLNSYFEIG
jgi:hypothetical protein